MSEGVAVELPDHDAPVPYIQRTHTYYRAIGYDVPYHYAHLSGAPFSAWTKKLASARIGLVTTAAPFQQGKGDQGPGAAYNSSAKYYVTYSMPTDGEPDLRISHIGYDRKNTSAVDMNTWFPLAAAKRAVSAGRIGGLAPRFHGVPTNRSQRTTIDVDAPEVLRRCREDGVDAVILVPNCPICHQVCAITARVLEAAGIPTVVMGCAKDIVEQCGVPRFLFSDFPLGNACGRPNDPASQDATLESALRLLEGAPGPRTTFQNPLRWSDDASWKLDYSNVERLSADDLARRRAEFLRQKEIARDIRETTIPKSRSA